MGPKFNDPILDGGDITVSGPFETHGRVVDDVVVRFLVVGDTAAQTIIGTATLPNVNLTRTTRSIGGGLPDLELTRGDFSVTVPNSARFKVDDKVRGIGLSAVLKAGDGTDPPAFETFTWCVNLTVAAPPGGP
jgi:hypothetical protein